MLKPTVPSVTQEVADSPAESDGRRRRLLLGDPLSDALDATHIVDGLQQGNNGWQAGSTDASGARDGANGHAHAHGHGACGAECGGSFSAAGNTSENSGGQGGRRDTAALVLWLSTSGGAASDTGTDSMQARTAPVCC